MSTLTIAADDRIQIGDDLYKLDGLALVKVNNLPTAPGLYAPTREVPLAVTSFRYLLLTTNGDWFWLDYTGTTPESVLEPIDASAAEKYEISPVDTTSTRKRFAV